MAKIFDTVRLKEIRERKREINEELGKEQRYTVTMEYYIYAEDSDIAIFKAKQNAGEQNSKLDNQATVKSVHISPFGWSSDSKQIYPKTT
jgi:hypothetical protein